MSVIETSRGVPVSGAFPDAVLQEKLPALRCIAEDLFGDPVTMTIESDPELDGVQYVIFSVTLKADLSQALPLRLEWYHRTAPLLTGRLDQVVLSIEVPE